MKIKFIILACLMLSVISAYPQKPKNAREVIDAMYNKYKNKWYENLIFAQAAIFYKDGKVEKEETWYEAISPRKGLVIKINGMDSGNGVLYRADSQYVWRDNKLTARVRRQNDLLILAFSVYTDEPGVTVAKLIKEGYDFDKFEINGDALVVGDENGPRFWIDAKTLLFTRMKRKNNDGIMSEIQFNKYQKLENGWIAPEVLFFRDGTLVMKEIYRDIKVPEKMGIDFSVPQDFSKMKW